jgi:hypothetical protein
MRHIVQFILFRNMSLRLLRPRGPLTLILAGVAIVFEIQDEVHVLADETCEDFRRGLDLLVHRQPGDPRLVDLQLDVLGGRGGPGVARDGPLRVVAARLRNLLGSWALKNTVQETLLGNLVRKST